MVDHDWGFTANATPDREVYYPRGRVMGGSSSVNGTLAIRGTPEDFDEWAALGNEGWSWEECLPSFRRLEHDLDASGDFHGKSGPLPIVRWRPDEMRPLSEAFLEVCQEHGFPYAEDFNDPEATGISPTAQNRQVDTRISTAMAYLEPIRNRLNLTIRGRLPREARADRGRARDGGGGGLRRRTADCPRPKRDPLGGSDHVAADPGAVGDRGAGGRGGDRGDARTGAAGGGGET